jgi:hypothetical protein
MNAQMEPIAQLTERAKQILVDALGANDTARFLNQLRAGSGNYTIDREAMFKGQSVKDIAQGIRAVRK